MKNASLDLHASHKMLTLLDEAATNTESVIDLIPGAFLIINEAYEILRVNADFSTLTDLEPEQLLRMSFARFFDASGWRMFADGMNRIVGLEAETKVIAFDVALSVKGATDEGIPFHWILTRLDVKSKGEGQLISVFGQDMSAIKYVIDQAAALRETKCELERDVARREMAEAKLLHWVEELSRLNAELKQTQQQLVQSEKLASIGQLAAGVAHEINNPIGFVQSNLGSLGRYFEQLMELLDRYHEGESQLGESVGDSWLGQVKQLIKRIDLDYLKEDIPMLLQESKDGIVRVKQIVSDLKDFSRVDSQQQWEWVDLRIGLNSTLNIVSNELKYRANVVKEFGELPQIKCLSLQINQVFMNLLVNAAQAMPEGKLGVITMRCGTEGDGVWVEIEDTGAGIPEENLSRIFDPFFTTKPIGKGTGLGLSLSYGIVRKHGGRIDVRSKIGAGSCFRISLPKEPPDSIVSSR
ncbi:MAG TPA: ATP-binding protein [Rhodocyclaceae bacterium]|nr:ATP-binding protein [Rhodocyclaceae bacterium]